MSKTWKYILFSFLFLVVIAGGYLAYRYFVSVRQSSVAYVDAIPPNTVMFAEFYGAASAYHKLAQSEWWQNLSRSPEIHRISQQAHYLDSVFRSDANLNDFLRKHKFILVFGIGDSSSLGVTYMLELPPIEKGLLFDNFVLKVNGEQSIVLQRKYGKAFIRVVNIPSINTFFYYTVYRGLFIGSLDENRVIGVINQVETGRSIGRQSEFRQLRSTAGRNVDANIYFNFKQFGKLSQRIATIPFYKAAGSLGNIAQWTETDLVINDKDLLLNGYTVTNDEQGNLLDAFRQEPQKVTVQNVLPDDIAFFFDFGIESFEKFYAAFLGFREDSTTCINTLSMLKSTFDIEPWADFMSWIGNEFAYCGVSQAPDDEFQPLAVIKANDILKARLSLTHISALLDQKSNHRTFQLKHGDYVINKINFPPLLATVFTPLFGNIRENYYVLVKDYVLFADQPEVLIRLLDRFYARKTLGENGNFLAFSDNVSDKSNIYFYMDPGKKPVGLSDYFISPLRGWFDENKDILSGFEGPAVQFSFINNMFYTNLYLKFDKDTEDINPTNWSCDLEAEIGNGPWLVKNHRNGNMNVIVFDALNNMYLIDHMGKIQWKLPLVEPPVSDLFVIDYYDNGKNQYLFNTENYLYLVDLNGDYVADYPVKLRKKATNGISVFDYDDNKDYRIIVALDDNFIYNFDKTATPVDGWNKIQANATVVQPVQHLEAAGLDYLFVTDEKGKVIITDRKGEERIKLKKEFENSPNSLFYINNTNSNGLFITTDRSGKLTYIGTSGEVKFTTFGDFSPDHYFIYDDFDRDGNKDFIYVDGKKLEIFDRFKNTVMDYDFPAKVERKPVLMKTFVEATRIGVQLSGMQKIILIGPEGRAYSKAEIQSNKKFVFGSMNRDDKINLVTGLGKTVYNYILERH